MTEKKFRQVCHCEKCGNEAEMEITCRLFPEPESETGEKKVKVLNEKKEGAISAHAVCSSCGSEADIWLETE